MRCDVIGDEIKWIVEVNFSFSMLVCGSIIKFIQVLIHIYGFRMK